MPSLKRIRTRIASVKNTQKITRAMKMIAAARLRKAQDAMTAARPYAKRLADVITDISARSADDGITHPLLEQRPVQRVRIIVISSDRGLAGGYNSNLLRKVERYLVDEGGNHDDKKAQQFEIVVVGRKARENWKRRASMVTGDHPGATPETVDSLARALSAETSKAFIDVSEGRIDAVFVAFNEFQSAISQLPTITQLLPIPAAPAEAGAPRLDFEYEPSKEEVLAVALPLYLEVCIRRMLLEAVASEFGAKMSAMDNATKNAKDMISSLTLEFNHARQAAITKELMEIVGGAEALKG